MLLIQSGVDPAAMIKMFQVLSKHSSSFPEAISTHPDMSFRLERLETFKFSRILNLKAGMFLRKLVGKPCRIFVKANF
ncbi:MAG: hypothetical protein CM1200mP30_32540 [Pseudomonadota bacterium]|nr:MAG: hypothetical protein CM1200mP30_32540 [Pseudomonadota bacterium]